MADTDEDIEKIDNLAYDNREIGEEELQSSDRISNYDSSDFISGPNRVVNGTVPLKILEFRYSFGYDCRKYFNLCVPDPDTIVFASGNLIHFFNVSQNKRWFRRTSTGGGIGHITKNPHYKHIAVGENGRNPPIIIYEWPSLEIVAILLEGTTRSYSHLEYSPDGSLLASQGGEPDYPITVWNWKCHRIILRCKSYGQDIYNVMFSPSVFGHLTTCGSGHIKFWKMTQTFTGLKLQGELGRFGKTEISDILGVYPMPDEKVVSGCEWGHILVWDEGLIKVEVCRKNGNPCHGDAITQFEYSNGELMSVGMDGWIRIWFYETIDHADPPEEDRFIEIEPIYEFHIAEEIENETVVSSMLMSIQKQNPEDPESTHWYAQDGNGGIWLMDLCTFKHPEDPRKIFTCHAGPIVDMAVSTWGPFVATFGPDGCLHFYNYLDNKLVLTHKFRRDTGGRVVWFPCSVEASGSTLVCGFNSGVIRMITVSLLEADGSNEIQGDFVRLLQVVKPHTRAITALTLNNTGRLLVTGSEDLTIFAFHVNVTESYPNLEAIGYVKVPSSVTCMAWKHHFETTILVGCAFGDCVEVALPETPQSYTKITYELVQSERRVFKFHSVKSAIRRESVRLKMEKKREAKRAKKRLQMEALKEASPAIEIDEETFLADSEEDPPLPEIHIPEVPNKVLMANYTSNGTIWLSMSGFDAGYMYEYPIPEKGVEMPLEPSRSTVICDADDTEIRSCCFYKDRKYVFLGMEHGEIRVCRLKQEDHTDLSDYWVLPMHDNSNGFIPKMLLSHDHTMLITCGHDGNLFSFVVNDDEPMEEMKIPQPNQPLPLPKKNAEDIEEPDHLSLEEVIVKAEESKIAAMAKQKKDKTLEILRSLTEEFNGIMDKNRELPQSQRISQEKFELDPRITKDLDDQLKAEMDLVHRKLAFKIEKSRLGLQKLMDHFIEPITGLPFALCKISNPKYQVRSLRERKLDHDFAETYKEIMEKLEENEKSGRSIDLKSMEEEEPGEEQQKVEGLESFLKGFSPSAIQYRLGVQINQLLRKYRVQKAKFEEREKQWKALHASKPDPTVSHPDDIAAIEHAKRTLGDYKLKIAPSFTQSSQKRETTLTKHKQLLDCRRTIHFLRENFNDKLRAARDKKVALQAKVLKHVETLRQIHAEIPEKKIKPLPLMFTIDSNVEFPEKNLELEKYTSMAERVKEAKLRRKSLEPRVHLTPLDEEYEVLLLDEKTIYLQHSESTTIAMSALSERKHKAQITVHNEVLQTLSANDRLETPWEREMKRFRVMRKIYQQDCILKEIEVSYGEFDEHLDELESERVKIVADSVYMYLYLLTLHRELIVLKDFEAMENTLRGKVDEKLREQALAKKKMLATNVKTDQRTKEISKLQENMKGLHSEYMSMINEDKYYDFLRRIFKKKYKPPKLGDDSSTDASSSSPSDSSTDEGNAMSLDSQEIGPLHLDEGVCPADCDRDLYQAAFAMRERRYEYESSIKEEQRQIEMLRKEIDAVLKRMKVIGSTLQTCENDLNAFLYEKQRRLNDIDMTVILKLRQLQHFIEHDEVAKVRDCVVFDTRKLSQLHARIGELKKEIEDQREKHNKDRMHLHRMKIDCKYMTDETRRLKSTIKQEMIHKFGQEVSLTALYEAVLRAMIYDLKANLNSMMKAFDKQIKCVKDRYSEEIQVLGNLIKDNTEKLSFLTVLEEERMKLKKILKQVPLSEEEIAKAEQVHEKDLARLRTILKTQMRQKELFKNDIRNLSMKSRTLPPLCSKEKSKSRRITSCDVTTHNIKDIMRVFGERRVEATTCVEFRGQEVEEGNKSVGRGTTDLSSLMVQHLASRIIETSLNDREIEADMQNTLTEVVSNLPLGGSLNELRAGIDQSIDNIMASIPEVTGEMAEFMRETVRESLNDIIHRLETESRNIEGNVKVEIKWDVKRKLGDLLHSAGVENPTEIEDELYDMVENSGGDLSKAIEFILSNLPDDVDEQTVAIVKEHVSVTLRELVEIVEIVDQKEVDDPRT